MAAAPPLETAATHDAEANANVAELRQPAAGAGRTFSRSRSTRVVSTSPAPRRLESTDRGSGSPAGQARQNRWRSASRTLRGSVDGHGASRWPYRSRSRSVHPSPAGKEGGAGGQASAGGTSSDSPHSRDSTDDDLEKGGGGGMGPSAKWFVSKLKPSDRTPLDPLLKHLPKWLEGYIWGWIGGFVGVGIVMLVFTRIKVFSDSSNLPLDVWTSPTVVGSFGASAVLLYAAPGSPLSQPRPFFLGQVLSAFVGVCLTKLFSYSPHYDVSKTDYSASLVWLAGSIATATAILVMQVTRNIHPPGGATALLSATSMPIVRLGWYYIPVVMLSSALMLAWAFIWLNLGRRCYPTWWLYPPEDVRKAAFPGPELGAYWRKYQGRRRRRNKERPSSVLPVSEGKRGTSDQAGSHQADSVPSGGSTSIQPGAQNGGDWRDETPWKSQPAPGAADAQTGDGVPGGEDDKERQSRWARA
ncbi:unnamed protein product [Parajaminaea phylloscopi]